MTPLTSRPLTGGTFNLGRRAAGGEAVALVSVDDHIDENVRARINAIHGVRVAQPLRF